MAGELQVENFAASNGWVCRLQYRHVLVYKKLAGKLQICFENYLHIKSMLLFIFFCEFKWKIDNSYFFAVFPCC